MTFSILNYQSDLEKILEGLSVPGRVAFAAWCAEYMLSKSFGYLTSKIGNEGTNTLRRALKLLWQIAEGVQELDKSTALLLNECKRIDWNSERIKDEEQLANIFAVDAVTCLLHAIDTCETESPKAAAMSGERIISNLAHQLSGKHGKSALAAAIFLELEFLAELERQKKMIEYLRSQPEISDRMKTVFRG